MKVISNIFMFILKFFKFLIFFSFIFLYLIIIILLCPLFFVIYYLNKIFMKLLILFDDKASNIKYNYFDYILSVVKKMFHFTNNSFKNMNHNSSNLNYDDDNINDLDSIRNDVNSIQNGGD